MAYEAFMVWPWFNAQPRSLPVLYPNSLPFLLSTSPQPNLLLKSSLLWSSHTELLLHLPLIPGPLHVLLLLKKVRESIRT